MHSEVGWGRAGQVMTVKTRPEQVDETIDHPEFKYVTHKKSS